MQENETVPLAGVPADFPSSLSLFFLPGSLVAVAVGVAVWVGTTGSWPKAGAILPRTPPDFTVQVPGRPATLKVNPVTTRSSSGAVVAISPTAFGTATGATAGCPSLKLTAVVP